jgi:hypothetical protein
MIAAATAWIRLAAAAVVVAALFAAWSVARALRTDDLPTSADATALGDVQIASRDRPPRVNVAAAVDADPFNPARARPTEVYMLPHELVVPAPAPRGEQLRVLGTVVSTTGSGFAMCQLGSQPPTIVKIGEKIGAYTLKRVVRGSATFAGPAGDVVIAAPQPGR